jgi:hypothetical protein
MRIGEGLDDYDAAIVALREKLDLQLSAENRLMLAYIEALDRRRDAQMQALLQAFHTGIGVIRVVRWAVTVGAAVAAIWAGFHAHLTVR